MENSLDFNYLTDRQKKLIATELIKVREEYVDINAREIRPRRTFYTVVVKRLLDIILSILALILTLPFNLILLIGTLCVLGLPLFFTQGRIGKDGKTFRIVKFRNMTNEKGANGELLPPERRIKNWGKFVRKTSLDELLNFWNILKGEMSLIGPRPLPVKYRKRFSKDHYQRHLVKPGLECPFVKPEYATGGWYGRFENDLWYVENISFKTDVKLLFKLVKKVFSKRERQLSASGQECEFVGYAEDGHIIDSNNVPEEYIIWAMNQPEQEENK